MHCHLELHQVEGMAVLIQEGHESLMNPPPRGFPTCGTFDWDSDAFWDKVNHQAGGQTTTSPTTPAPSSGDGLSGSRGVVLVVVAAILALMSSRASAVVINTMC